MVTSAECPYCKRSFDAFVTNESYAGKYITVDIPTDLVVGEAVIAKNFLYKACEMFNESAKGRVRFNLESLK